MGIYTKRGDRGETGLYSSNPVKPRRISKTSMVIAAIGIIDEANSFLGICVNLSKQVNLKQELERIQRDLFTIGSILAGAKLKLDQTRVKIFEKEIDKLEGYLPVLANFILPGGSSLGAHLHFARTLVRRAERALMVLPKLQSTYPEIVVYVNRLSDYLFMLAREVNLNAKKKEKFWVGNK